MVDPEKNKQTVSDGYKEIRDREVLLWSLELQSCLAMQAFQQSLRTDLEQPAIDTVNQNSNVIVLV
jgi:hypothetical protein